MDDLQYPDPVQPGNVGGDGLGSRVTRQPGLPPPPVQSIDPTPLPPVVQGSVDIFTMRQSGNGAERFGDDGVLRVDRPIEGNTEFVDGPFMGLGDPAAMPPGIERTQQPLPPRPGFDVPPVTGKPMDRDDIRRLAEAAGFSVTDAPPVAGVVAADAPAPGGADPRDLGSAPKVFGADDLPVIKKRPVVPVDVGGEAAPKVKKTAKKGGR